MPRIACPSGRTRIRAGKAEAIWHKKNGTSEDCPICFANTPAIAPATEPSPTPAVYDAGSGAEAGATHPAPVEARKPGLIRRLGFGNRETSPELPIAPPKNKPPEYFVDAKHTVEFANLIYGGVRWLFDLADKFLLTKEAGMKTFTEAHPELLKLSEFEKEGITLDPQSDLWGKAATGFTRLVGCKTQAQAHSAIDTVSFLGHFGMLIGFATDHYWHAWQDGKPYRAAKKAAKKAAIAARRLEVKAHGRNPQVEGGNLAEARPAGAPTAA